MNGALRANGWLLFAARRFLSKSFDPRSRNSRNATAPRCAFKRAAGPTPRECSDPSKIVAQFSCVLRTTSLFLPKDSDEKRLLDAILLAVPR